MSRFEYLSVLVSIVIALGISEIVSSWGRLIQSRALVRFSWVQAFWSAFAVVLMVQFWWGFWEFRVVEHWSFPGLLAVVTECLVLVLAGMVLVPGGRITEPIDLGEHYTAHSPIFFGLGALLLVQLSLIDRFVGGQPFLHPENAFRLPGVAVAIVGATARSEKVHLGLAVLASVLLAGFLVFAFTR